MIKTRSASYPPIGALLSRRVATFQPRHKLRTRLDRLHLAGGLMAGDTALCSRAPVAAAFEVRRRRQLPTNWRVTRACIKRLHAPLATAKTGQPLGTARRGTTFAGRTWSAHSLL
ncbi:hypothetical protein LSAT2_020003 [Lamellibrachia satsuma]|nr:hypothetical protein LSAT2_020003 [Lamellibrachia satsuma]